MLTRYILSASFAPPLMLYQNCDRVTETSRQAALKKCSTPSNAAGSGVIQKNSSRLQGLQKHQPV
jgi:hypothetical protein